QPEIPPVLATQSLLSDYCERIVQQQISPSEFAMAIQFVTKVALLALLLIGGPQLQAEAGIIGAVASYGVCQTGCNTVWVACVAAAGGVAGVSTGGTAVPAAILACNAANGVCMAGCASVTLLAPTP
ncbi:hypothetical protein BOX15_Mlig004286g2, partial [Macrostomum lignano]